MKEYKFTVVYERDGEGRILAICPAFYGCYSEGETEEEARANIREAIEAHLESRLAYNEPIPVELRNEAISFAL